MVVLCIRYMYHILTNITSTLYLHSWFSLSNNFEYEVHVHTRRIPHIVWNGFVLNLCKNFNPNWIEMNIIVLNLTQI